MSRSPNAPRFDRRPSKPTLHPRRVVGGIRLQARIAPEITPGDPADAKPTSGWTWASARWVRLAESSAPVDQLTEGLQYAQLGQTRGLEIKPGHISARIQGRMPSAYKTALRLPTFTHEQWEQVVASMTQQAKYAAAILSGELPAHIEDLFAPHGLRLFPTDPADLSPSCNCSVFTGIEPLVPTPMGGAPAPPPPPPIRNPGIPWCKHVCCLMYLFAERLGAHPLLILSLRGMPESDLIERLRQARALAGMQKAGGIAPGGAAPVYVPHVPLAERASHPLAESIHDFWRAPDPGALAEVDLPIAPPEVSQPLLRRLGPSPFPGAKFPLVGLLATCYDVISQATIRAEQTRDAPEPPSFDPGVV
jgi:uncharacterized Zn finger protein